MGVLVRRVAIVTGASKGIGRVTAERFVFSITWTEAGGPGWTRTYSRFTQLAEEAARSRVYGGIHFNFDTTSSFGVCSQLGDYIFTNTFRLR